MKVAYRGRYGGPEVLSVRELPVPEPSPDQVLVRVKAATVNRTDCGILSASPFVIRAFTGLFAPKIKGTGTDFAGVVVALGRNVTGLDLGERIMGFSDNGLGSHAEYICIDSRTPFVKIPEGIPYPTAVASMEGAHYAVNFLNKVELSPDSTVLVNGASGAIGSALIQLLLDKGIQVSATCLPDHTETLSAYPFHKLYDLGKTGLPDIREKFDVIFDAVGKSTFGVCKPLLKREGVYISSELGPGGQNLFFSLFAPLFPGKKVRFPVPFDIRASLVTVRDMLVRGTFMPLIDRTYPLDQVKDAFVYVRSGKKTGNVILSMC